VFLSTHEQERLLVHVAAELAWSGRRPAALATATGAAAHAVRDHLGAAVHHLITGPQGCGRTAHVAEHARCERGEKELAD
jgi:hypothetical protein